MNKAKLGDVEFDVVETESPTDSAEITSFAVEDGREFADHHAIKPSSLNITGIFGARGSDKKLATLKKYQRDAELLRYEHRNIYTNMAIVSISRDHTGDNAFGFSYTIQLQEVPIQSAKRIELKMNIPKTSKPATKKKQTKVKKTSNKGRQQTKKSGASANIKAMAKKKSKVYVPKRPNSKASVGNNTGLAGAQ